MTVEQFPPLTTELIARLQQINEASFTGPELPPAETFKSMLFISRLWIIKTSSTKEVIGYALINDEGGPNRATYLWTMAVLPAFREGGVGSMLVSAIAHWMDDEVHRPFLYLHARRDNVSAQKFYLDNGFLYCRTIPDHYGAGIDGVLMRRDM